MYETVTIVNPNVAANVAITIPNGLAVDKIELATLLDTGDYPDAGAVPPLALVIDSTFNAGTPPEAGHIALESPSQVNTGTALNDGYQTLVLRLRVVGTKPKTTYGTTGVNQSGFGY